MPNPKRKIVTPEQLKEGWVEFSQDEIPNIIKHKYSCPIKRSDGNWEVDEEKQASSEIAQSRERFEKFAHDKLLFDYAGDFRRDDLGYYRYQEVQSAWLSYQAAELDTRKRIVLEIKEIARRWRGPGSEAVDFLVERIRGKE